MLPERCVRFCFRQRIIALARVFVAREDPEMREMYDPSFAPSPMVALRPARLTPRVSFRFVPFCCALAQLPHLPPFCLLVPRVYAIFLECAQMLADLIFPRFPF